MMSYTRISLSLLALIALPSHGMENNEPVSTTEQPGIATPGPEMTVPVEPSLPTLTVDMAAAAKAVENTVKKDEDKQQQKPSLQRAAPTPAFETQKKPWNGWVLSNDPITTVLAYCNGLKAKPAGDTTIAAKNISFGINETIKKAANHRKLLTEKPWSNSIANLQDVIRTNSGYTRNLETMITKSDEFGIKLSKNQLAGAYYHLQQEDTQAVAYAYTVFKEAQDRLKENKKLRRVIQGIQPERGDMGCISDDEYDDQSLCNHLLTWKVPADTDKK